MTLADLKHGQMAEIAEIHAESAERERLNAFGLDCGGRFRLLRAAPFGGPLLIEELLSGARTMIAREVAAHIEVSEVFGEPRP